MSTTSDTQLGDWLGDFDPSFTEEVAEARSRLATLSLQCFKDGGEPTECLSQHLGVAGPSCRMPKGAIRVCTSCVSDKLASVIDQTHEIVGKPEGFGVNL